MSPLVVRRYRAERLLRDEFDGLRAAVLAPVRGRLSCSGVVLDVADLEACYSQAWQGLYAAVLDGAQIDDPRAWLTLVTYRRAIDEHRSRRAIAFAPASTAGSVERSGETAEANADVGAERDIPSQLDDRARLRQLFEALRARLSVREREAATLCYLQGFSRADAAARMGLSESRMRKLMDGRGIGSPGVAAKMGALVDTIGAGEWCDEQGSLMRGLAYGILDPEGERYRLALLHRDTCPGCRAYVLSLRGLAAVLPPAPAVLHWALGAAAAGGVAAGGGGGVGSAVAPGGVSAPASGAAVVPAGSAAAGGVLSASGAAGVGAVGGSWWLAGGLGAKLAVSCLLALGVGVGCVALGGGSGRAPRHRFGATRDAPVARRRANGAQVSTLPSVSGEGSNAPRRAPAPASPTYANGAAQASREFGPEQAAAGAAASKSAGSGEATASASSAGRRAPTGVKTTAPPGSAASTGADEAAAGALPAAQREFSPG